jgi:hypothetical protein
MLYTIYVLYITRICYIQYTEVLFQTSGGLGTTHPYSIAKIVAWYSRDVRPVEIGDPEGTQLYTDARQNAL